MVVLGNSKMSILSPFQLPYLLPLTILILIILPIITLIRIRYRRGLREIPGPFFASILPLDRMLSTYSGHQFQRHLDYHAKYGKLVRVGPNHVSLGESDQISNVYSITSRFDKVSPLLCSRLLWLGPKEQFFDENDCHRAISTPSFMQNLRSALFPQCFPSSTRLDTRT